MQFGWLHAALLGLTLDRWSRRIFAPFTLKYSDWCIACYGGLQVLLLHTGEQRFCMHAAPALERCGSLQLRGCSSCLRPLNAQVNTPVITRKINAPIIYFCSESLCWINNQIRFIYFFLNSCSEDRLQPCPPIYCRHYPVSLFVLQLTGSLNLMGIIFLLFFFPLLS